MEKKLPFQTNTTITTLFKCKKCKVVVTCARIANGRQAPIPTILQSAYHHNSQWSMNQKHLYTACTWYIGKYTRTQKSGKRRGDDSGTTHPTKIVPAENKNLPRQAKLP
mmetsp:Transcript_1174/g.2547  ORF Transcript_1174/g.2547 Transcript_1174/m.2547 type:complete len:109 (+) Transcript_1174:954-1280(+)